MNRVFFIRGPQGEHHVGESDLPLSIGGPNHCDVVLPGLPAGKVAAHIALSEGHAYIQPADDSLPLFHNHEHLSGSHWLKSGDQVQLGKDVLEWTVKGDQVFISVHQRTAAPEPVPPDTAPPAAPIPDSPEQETTIPPAHVPKRLWRLFVAIFVVLLLVAVFILVATPVALRITPQPDTQRLSGFPPVIPLGDRLLALPGQYDLHARRVGYHPLKTRVDIARGGFRELRFELEELPGRVRIHVEPGVDFRLSVDKVSIPVDAGGIALIGRGIRLLRIETERYLPEERELGVEGLGKIQDLHLNLRPAWAEVSITSQPSGAEVRIDGETTGITPLVTEILQGEREIVLGLDGHKPVTLRPSITAGSILRLDEVVLPPADGRLALTSTPTGATVSVDGNFSGSTPLTLVLTSGDNHQLRMDKPGYQTTSREISLTADEERDLAVILPPQYGVIFVTTRPADASLVVDGKPSGKATRRLRLTTRPHTLEFRKPGYATQQVTVTPRQGVSQNLDITLQTAAQANAEATPGSVRTAAGQILRLVRPASTFRMGASRREAGRRANESRRLVQLTRPFYLGMKEVTNGEYRKFQPAHDSGVSEGAALNEDNLPVVNVSWDDAARYCNWLSRQDGLPPAYREQDAHMVPVEPSTTGYRLPTEAEWAYVSRVLSREEPARYPWTGSYPPTKSAGNFADLRISDTLADVVPGYDDGYRATAPGGSFPASPPGFHDLGGNVAEWTGDYYAVYPGEAEQLAVNPAGPPSGEHHVVRGSSWRQGSIIELRLSYRDYSRSQRDDLGFRIARYAGE